MRSNLLTDSADEAEFHASLRNLRRHAMLHSIFRDINGLASLDEIVTTISTLADITVQAAQQFHASAVSTKFGLSADAACSASTVVAARNAALFLSSKS